jgi:hypothetical protein
VRASSPTPDGTTALLRHVLPSGAWHFDWLVALRAPADEDERCAHTWRMSARPDRLAPGERAALDPAPLHRGRYLRLVEAVELDGGRGRVEPVAHGRVLHASGTAGDGPDCLEVAWKADRVTTYRILRADGTTCVECVGTRIGP